MPFDSQMICGNCRYHVPSDKYPWEWECSNKESEMYGQFTEYEDKCEEWDYRPPKKKRGEKDTDA